MAKDKKAIKFKVYVEKIRLEMPTLNLVYSRIADLLKKSEEDGDVVLTQRDLENLEGAFARSIERISEEIYF